MAIMLRNLPADTRHTQGIPAAPEHLVQRGLLLVAATLAIGVALLVTWGVIPPVRDLWVPNASGADAAVAAFWVSVGANLVFAGVLIATAVFDELRRAFVCWVLAILAVGALLQAGAYLDAGAAFHGPLAGDLLPATTRLRFAALADATAGVLVFVATVTALRTRKVPTG